MGLEEDPTPRGAFLEEGEHVANHHRTRFCCNRRNCSWGRSIGVNTVLRRIERTIDEQYRKRRRCRRFKVDAEGMEEGKGEVDQGKGQMGKLQEAGG